jgi:hypothetical protein
MLDIRHAEEFLILDVASGFAHPRLLADLIGDAGPTSSVFGDAEGALIEFASRYSRVFRADGPNWRPVSARGVPIPNYPTLGMRVQARGSVRFPATYGYELGASTREAAPFHAKQRFASSSPPRTSRPCGVSIRVRGAQSW